MKRLTPEAMQERKQAIKDFGGWRSFFLGYALFTVFSFFGLLFNIVSSSVLISIPLYLGFAGLVTFAYYLSIKLSQEGNKRKGITIIVSIGALIAIMQIFIGYLNEYWMSDPITGSSPLLVFAILLRNETIQFMNELFPSYGTQWKKQPRTRRFGILLLSLVGLIPLAAGWAVYHFLISSIPTRLPDSVQILFFAIPLVLFGYLIRDVLNARTSHFKRLTLFIILSLGAATGVATGSDTIIIADEMMPQLLVTTILYTILASEVLATLMLWYLFVLIPKHLKSS